MSDQDRAEVENLFSRYALGYDEGDLELVADCLTEDATMTIRVAGAELVGPFDGRDAILGMMRETAQSQHDRRRHVLSNLLLEVDGETARARTYLTLFSVADAALRTLTTGSYDTELRCTPHGWRLATVHVELDLPY